MQKNIYYIGSHWICGKGKEFVLLLIFIEVSVPSQESQDHAARNVRCTRGIAKHSSNIY
jgi:hypothetical protein